MSLPSRPRNSPHRVHGVEAQRRFLLNGGGHAAPQTARVSAAGRVGGVREAVEDFWGEVTQRARRQLHIPKAGPVLAEQPVDRV